MPVDPKHVETIFNAVLAVAPADRPAFLAVECRDDADLRARVERLLAAHAELDAAPGTMTHAPGSPTASLGGNEATTSGLPETEDRAPQSDADAVIAGKYKLI